MQLLPGYHRLQIHLVPIDHACGSNLI
jgi:hypothetical protein